MKLTLYVHPISFAEFLVGDKAVFMASLQSREEYCIPVLVTKEKYIFETIETTSNPSVFRVYRYQNQNTGPR